MSDGSEVELVPAKLGSIAVWFKAIANVDAQLDGVIEPYRQTTVGGFR